ncbi:MAG: hypothetical protein AMXMBFR82_29550 [Candidatus Hydrogenedentota bacterium]
MNAVFYAVFAGLALVHVMILLFLVWWRRKNARSMASFLDSVIPIREGRTRNSSDPYEAVESFVLDIRGILASESRKEERMDLAKRISIKEEGRTYLRSTWYESVVSLFVGLTDTYPIIGILGTVVGIRTALGGDVFDNAEMGERLVDGFATAVNTTWVGLILWLVAAIVTYWTFPGFESFSELRKLVGETVHRASVEVLGRNAEEVS